MAEETGRNELATNQILPTGSDGAPAPAPAPTAGAEVVRNAPAAVKRSMPMALSITLGILLAVAAGVVLYRLTWFILIMYLSFIAATVLDAPVNWMQRHRLPRGLATIIVMVGGLGVIVGVLVLIASWLSGQAKQLVTNFHDAPQKLNALVDKLSKHFPGLGDQFKDFHPADVIGSVAPSLSSIVNNAMAGVEIVSWIVIMFFLVLYMLLDGPEHLKSLRVLLPKHVRLEATKLFTDIARAHRGWALASAANVASSTILTGTGLLLLGIPGAYILGFFAGLGEIIPNIGPIVAATPALLLTLVAAPDKFLWVVGMFLVVWTIQGYTISPLMMKFSVELPVLVTIIAVLVFGTLFGFLGILVSVPLVADMVVIWGFWNARREQDPWDYDEVNRPPTDRREPIKAAIAPARA